MLAVFDFRAPAQDVPWRVLGPVRPTVLPSLGGINQDADVPVPDALASGFVGPNVEVVALQINVEKLLSNNIAHVFKSHRLTGQHARQHPLKPAVKRRKR